MKMKKPRLDPPYRYFLIFLAVVAALVLLGITAKYWLVPALCFFALVVAFCDWLYKISPKIAQMNPQRVTVEFLYFCFIKPLLRVYLLDMPTLDTLRARLERMNGPHPTFRAHLARSLAFDGSLELCNWLREVLNRQSELCWIQAMNGAPDLPPPIIVTKVKLFAEEMLVEIVFANSNAARAYADDLIRRDEYCPPCVSVDDAEF